MIPWKMKPAREQITSAKMALLTATSAMAAGRDHTDQRAA